SQIDLWGLESERPCSRTIGWFQEKLAEHCMLPGWKLREKWMREGAKRQGKEPREDAIHPEPRVVEVEKSERSSKIAFFSTLGILTSDEDADEILKNFSRKYTGFPLEMVTNPSCGLLGDLLYSAAYLCGKEHPAVPLTVKYLMERLGSMDPEARLHWLSFSQGTELAKQTLALLGPEYKSRICVWAMGGPVSIKDDDLYFVCNYRCLNDVVAWMGGSWYELCFNNVEYLGIGSYWPPLIGDHRIQGGLYERQYEILVQEVLKEAA
ncbi:MAG: hypothetical protein JSR80_03350, partial [Verrucomicrobia bacterium]|nr:hypothetical protein [Verrucomicrobiota bacterium]